MYPTLDTLSAIGPELTDEQIDEATGGLWPVVVVAAFLYGYYCGATS